MELSMIEQLIKLLDRSTLSSLEIEEDGIRIKLDRTMLPQQVSVSLPAAANAGEATGSQARQQEPANDDEFDYVKSPMVGLFYSLSSLGKKDPEIGSVIKKGTLLCAIEAMKLINEIESDIEGELVEILVQNGDQVEYGQNLFKLRKL